MNRRSLTALVGCSTAALLLLTGCTASSTTSGGGSSGSSTTSVTVATPAIASSYDWDAGGIYTNENFETNENTQANLIRNPYVASSDKGVQTQDYSKFEGVLADSKNPYTLSKDGLTYTFNLRKNVKSQAGNPFTADDVIYSFQRKYNVATSPTPGVLKPYFAGLADIKKVDEYHVAFTVKKPSDGFTFLGVLANLYGRVYDSKVIKAHATAKDPYALNWTKQNSGWGYGAYTVQSMTPNQQLVLVANKNYVFGEPAIKKVVLKQVSDPGTRVTLLQSGSVQFAEQLRPADQASLKGSSQFTVPTLAHPIEFLDLATVTNKAPFDNKAVRQALRKAIPYSEIIRQVYSGRAILAQGLINPTTKGYTTAGINTGLYDAAASKALLKAAGITTPVKFSLHVSNTVPDAVDAATLIKSYAAKAGFDVTVQQDPSAAFATGRSGGTFQALIYRTRAQTQSPVYSTASWFLPDNNSGNVPRWENSEFYKLVDQGRAIADPLSTAAGVVWNKTQRLVQEEAPETALIMIQPSNVWSSSMAGYVYRTDSTVEFSRIKGAS
jgi:peptide/nickel transport system substrate-binding protein